MNLLIWMVLRLHLHDPETLMEDPTIDCPFFEKTTVDIYLCELPLFVILFFNTFFLIWIMVVSKLYQLLAFIITKIVSWYIMINTMVILHTTSVLQKETRLPASRSSSIGPECRFLFLHPKVKVKERIFLRSTSL